MPYYSTEDNVTDFDEFDPTPYGGGYDQGLTYGRPLPPSDEICYSSSSTSGDFEYERPDYSSAAAHPFSAYADDALTTEYGSYSRRARRNPKSERPHADHRRRKQHGDDDNSDGDDDNSDDGDDNEEKRRRRRHRRRGSEDDD